MAAGREDQERDRGLGGKGKHEKGWISRPFRAKKKPGETRLSLYQVWSYFRLPIGGIVESSKFADIFLVLHIPVALLLVFHFGEPFFAFWTSVGFLADIFLAIEADLFFYHPRISFRSSFPVMIHFRPMTRQSRRVRSWWYCGSVPGGGSFLLSWSWLERIQRTSFFRSSIARLGSLSFIFPMFPPSASGLDRPLRRSPASPRSFPRRRGVRGMETSFPR